MANLTIKNLPREIHAGLKRNARLHGRSLNQEVVQILSREARRPRLDVEAFLKRIAARNARLKLTPLTDEMLRTARNEGRP